jgi:anti-sigma B factor antagonist
MNIEFTEHRRTQVVRILDPRIDAEGVGDLTARVARRMETGAMHILLDLAEVAFVDSAGLGGILSVLKRLPAGGSLTLCGCRPAVLELLRLTRLDRILRLAPSVGEALAVSAA